jgi:hypothetical protein
MPTACQLNLPGFPVWYLGRAVEVAKSAQTCKAVKAPGHLELQDCAARDNITNHFQAVLPFGSLNR